MLLLAGCVPDGEPVHECVYTLGIMWILNSDKLLEAGGVDGRLLAIYKLIVAEPHCDRGLTDSCCNSDDQRLDKAKEMSL